LSWQHSPFKKNSHVCKLQVTTFDKWIFPSERNQPAQSGQAFLIEWYNKLFFIKVKSLQIIWAGCAFPIHRSVASGNRRTGLWEEN